MRLRHPVRCLSALHTTGATEHTSARLYGCMQYRRALDSAREHALHISAPRKYAQRTGALHVSAVHKYALRISALHQYTLRISALRISAVHKYTQRISAVHISAEHMTIHECRHTEYTFYTFVCSRCTGLARDEPPGP